MLQAILDITDDAVIIVEKTGTIALVNGTAESMFGYGAGEMQGLPSASLVAPSDIEAHKQLQTYFLANRTAPQRHPVQIRVRRKDGSKFAAELKFTFTMHQARQVSLLIVRDVTERAALTEQLRRSQRLDAIGKLTTGIAHDFNNILSVININLDACRDRAIEDPTTVAYIDRCFSATKLSASMTSRLLAFAREATRGQHQAVTASTYVSSAVALLRYGLGKRIAVIEEYNDAAWLCYIDPGQLENAVINLAINARDAMPKGGTLKFSVGCCIIADAAEAKALGIVPGEYVAVEVDDTGVGLSDEAAARAFEPFFTTKGPSKGTGLGLSMVQKFAAQAAGCACLINKPEGGVLGRILMPRFIDTKLAHQQGPISNVQKNKENKIGEHDEHGEAYCRK
jgi:PAS domain S-box-containing protein